MLTPKVEERLSLLLKYHGRGDMMPEEIGYCLALLVNANNLDEVLARLSPDLLGELKAGLIHSTQDIAAAEHLHPEDSPFDGWAYHYSRIADLLVGPGLEQLTFLSAVCSTVCLPSFGPEWYLRLVSTGDRRPEQRTFCLVLNEAEKKLSAEGSAQTHSVNTFQSPVPHDLADRLSEVWRIMLLGTRPSQSRLVGFDGVNYHFTHGRMAGRIWSPRPDTPPGQLVDLSHALREWVKAGDDQKGVIFAHVENHLNWFRQHFGANMRTPSWTAG